MSNIVGKFMNFIGLEETEEEFEPEVAAADDWKEEIPRKRKAGLVSIPGNNRNVRVVVMHPRTLEDGQAIADQIKSHRPVIVNVDLCDERNTQRLLNFLSGVVYAVEGGLRKVGDGIFLVTPANVEVASAETDEDSPLWVGHGMGK